MCVRRLLSASILWCLLIMVQSAVEEGAISEIDPRTTLECHRREYTFKAIKTDSLGRKCWDHLRIMSCWGRCDSFEISDWRFPYKKSFHPVCIHESSRLRRVILHMCDPEVDENIRIYEYLEATSCSCQKCNTSAVSCEGPQHHRRHFPYSISSSYIP